MILPSTIELCVCSIYECSRIINDRILLKISIVLLIYLAETQEPGHNRCERKVYWNEDSCGSYITVSRIESNIPCVNVHLFDQHNPSPTNQGYHNAHNTLSIGHQFKTKCRFTDGIPEFVRNGKFATNYRKISVIFANRFNFETYT